MSAFRFDRDARSLDYINMQPTLGSITAHNCLTRDGRFLMAANYGMGSGGPDQSLAVFGIRDDGGLTPPVASVAHAGQHSAPTPARQERGHAHSITETVGRRPRHRRRPRLRRTDLVPDRAVRRAGAGRDASPCRPAPGRAMSRCTRTAGSCS